MKTRITPTKATLLLLTCGLLLLSNTPTASACWGKRPKTACGPTPRQYAVEPTYGTSTPPHLFEMGQYYESLQSQEGHQQAFDAYLESAQGGDSRAAYRVAQLYEQGLYGTPRNMEQAIYWYERSNDARAKYRLAQLAEMGRGMSPSPQKAIAYYTQAADAGDGRAIYRLAQNYKAKPSKPIEQLTEPNKDQAAYWLETSAKAGDGRSQYQLGRAYHTGQSPWQKDLTLASHWYEKAAMQGDTRAMFYLGQVYEFGGAGLQNRAKAYAWYRLAKDYHHGWAVAPLARVQKRLTAGGQLAQGVRDYEALKAQHAEAKKGS